MSFLNGDTSTISSAQLADNANTAVNETDKYNLWTNAAATAEAAEEQNSTLGSKAMMVTGFAGIVVSSVLLGGKVFGDDITKVIGENEDGTKITDVVKENSNEVKWAIAIVIVACAVLAFAGVITSLKGSARSNQLADDMNKTAIEDQKSLQEQAKLMIKRHKESTDADTKLYKQKSALIGKSLANTVARQTDQLINESKRSGLDLVREASTIKDTETLSATIDSLTSINNMKSAIENAGMLRGSAF